MARNSRSFLAREGRLYIVTTVVVALLVSLSNYAPLSIPLWIIAAFFIFVFRATVREIPPSPLGVISPVDGSVVAVTDTRDPYIDREAKAVTLRIKGIGEYAISSPTEGKIVEYWVRSALNHRGKEVTRFSYWIQTDEKDDVAITLSSRFWSRPSWYVNVGERIGQGQRCGYMAFGGEVVVFLPANSRINVSVGEKVLAGADVIAVFIHE